MSENKFIAKLKGEPTPKSVVEIQNDRLVAPFKSSPMGHIADRDSSVVAAKGAQNWAVNQGQLVPVADDYIGTESDLSGISRVSGAGLWLNATYTFPATDNEKNPVSAIIAPSAKWVLTLCGDSLMTQNGSVITLTMLIKIGGTHLTTKQFKIRECASQFSHRLAIDFSESEQKVIKAYGTSQLTVQILCDDEGASATIYSGMTHLTLLQRKVDADLVSTDNVLLPEFIENLLEGYIIPEDFFNRYEYLEQVREGENAMPRFTRNGDEMTFTGWSKGAEYKAGANITISEDNVISSTAQESFFRGRYATWTSVPTTGDDYTADFRGDKTPSYNDYIVVEDASLYIPQDFASDPRNVMIRNLHSAGVNYTIEVSIHGVVRRIYWTAAKDWTPLTDWLSIKYEKGGWQIKTVKEFYLNNEFMAAANGAWLLKNETSSEEQFYLSEKPGVAPLPIYGSWRFVYHGVWADDNILGWKPEYQIEEVMPIATETQAGIAKLYKTSGSNTDGAMTQKAVGDAISAHNAATNAHSNIRGVAGGLATLDNNAKVPMSQINDALLGNVSYQGLWNAAENVPFLADPSGDIQLPKGDYYITSVAGDRFGLHFDVGDWVISTGEGWTKVDNTDAVSAVNGMTGNVVLGATDVGAYTKEEVDALVGSGGGSSLPDQTDNAGKFLTTDGTTASWSDKPLVNNNYSQKTSIIIVPEKKSNIASRAVAIGVSASVSNNSVHIGYNSYDILNGGGSVGIGYATQTKNNAIAIGNWVKAQANYAIQIGYNAENYDSNTFKVANQNGNFEIMSADGTIPAERMSTTAGTTGQVLTKTDAGMGWSDVSSTRIIFREWE